MRSKKCRCLVDLVRPFEADFFFSDGYSEIVAVNLCVCTSVRKRLLERAFGIRSNWIISKTSLDASKSSENLRLYSCRRGNFRPCLGVLRRVVDKLRK